MHDLSSQLGISNMLQSMIDQEVLPNDSVEYIIENEEQIFRDFSMKSKTLLWNLTKKDRTGRLKVLGIGYDIFPAMFGTNLSLLLPMCYRDGPKKLKAGVLKVFILCFFLFSCQFCFVHGNMVEEDENFIYITSHLKSSQLISTTEIFNLAPLKIFENEVSSALNHSSILDEYSISKKGCKDTEADDLIEIMSLGNINKSRRYRLNHIEKDDKKDFMVAIFSNEHITECFVSFSAPFEKQLVSLNLFRRKLVNHQEALNYVNPIRTGPLRIT